MLDNIGVGYALAYMVGTILVILIIRYAPRIMRLNLEAMALTYARQKGIITDRKDAPTTADTYPIVRAYRVGDGGHGKTLEQRRAELGAEGVALKVRRNGKLMEPRPPT
jgi:putative transport protein